ncbi:MAG: AAA family ATPase, partial [bacterium]|nr:AAA family ATPase [bacterium]
MNFTEDSEEKPGVEMDFSQKQAWAASVNAKNPVVAVQGPPGTGKTWVLIQVIRFLCGQGKRILVTAPSNTAVDNICKRILDLPILRMGNIDKTDPVVLDACRPDNHENVRAYIEKKKKFGTGAVYAATHVRALFDTFIGRELEENGLFDAVFFDEAGMSRMDEFLLCAKLGNRVIVFGDQQQLPPFPLSAEVLGKLNRKHRYVSAGSRQIIDCGALEWLAHNRNLPVIMLQRSYRCQNPRLLRFSSTLFYDARVKTSEKAEYFQLSYTDRQEKYPPSTLRFYRT